MRTVFTSNPSAATKPYSCATTSGNVPLSVGVLDAKLTFLAATAGVPVKTITISENKKRIIFCCISLKSWEVKRGEGQARPCIDVSFRVSSKNEYSECRENIGETD